MLHVDRRYRSEASNHELRLILPNRHRQNVTSAVYSNLRLSLKYRRKCLVLLFAFHSKMALDDLQAVRYRPAFCQTVGGFSKVLLVRVQSNSLVLVSEIIIISASIYRCERYRATFQNDRTSHAHESWYELLVRIMSGPINHLTLADHAAIHLLQGN